MGTSISRPVAPASACVLRHRPIRECWLYLLFVWIPWPVPDVVAGRGGRLYVAYRYPPWGAWVGWMVSMCVCRLLSVSHAVSGKIHNHRKNNTRGITRYILNTNYHGEVTMRYVPSTQLSSTNKKKKKIE